MHTDLFDDEYDPLAPPPPTPGEAQQQAALGEEGDGGFGGGDGIVRIWFGEDGRLSKVRVSPVWYQRLQGSDTLEGAFHQAFRLSGMRVASAEPLAAAEPEPERLFTDVPEPTSENIERHLQLMFALQREWRQEMEAAEAPAPRPPARGKSEGVTVTLDDAGHPAHIEFDQMWLDDAQVGPLCVHVMEATHKAYQRYVPHTDPRLELMDRYRAAHETLVSGLHRMLNPNPRGEG